MVKLSYRQVGGVYNEKNISVGIFMVDETFYYVDTNRIMLSYLYAKAWRDGCVLWCSADSIKDCYDGTKHIKNLTEKLYIVLDVCNERNFVIGQQRFYYSKVSNGVYQLKGWEGNGING